MIDLPSALAQAQREDLTVAEALVIERALGLTITDLRGGNRPCSTCNGAPPHGFACLACGSRRSA